jgi:hypothetical protein
MKVSIRAPVVFKFPVNDPHPTECPLDCIDLDLEVLGRKFWSYFFYCLCLEC